MKHTVTIFFLCISTFILAQNKTLKLKPLNEVLVVLESKFNVRFSFSDEIIAHKTISLNLEDNNANLQTIIAALETETSLNFKEVTKRYYVITAPSKFKNISGFIYDFSTRIAIEDAIVWVKNKVTSTNDKGFFTLNDIANNDSLKISQIGYKTITKSSNEFKKHTIDTIFLEDNIAELDEVIITNYLTNGISKNSDGAIIFRPKTQQVLPGLTEPDVLLSVQQLPGVNNIDETASGLYVRGGSPDQNLMLFNNIKLFNTSHFFGAISALNPYIIDKVTVYRTASNVKYGNHISGVVDIETENDVPKKTTGGIGVNFMHVDANIKAPISKKVGVVFSARRSTTDFLDTPTFKKLSEKTFQHTIISEDLKESKSLDVNTENNFHYSDFSSKIIYNPSEKDQISFNQIFMKNELDYSFSELENKENRKDDLEIENIGYGINWNRILNEKTTQKVSVTYSNYKLLYRNYKINDSKKYAFTDKDNNVKNLDIQAIIHHQLNKQSAINFGYQYAYSDVSYSLEKENRLTYESANTFAADSNNSHTIFGEYLYKKDKNFTLNIGLRTNYFSLLNKVTLEPRIFSQLKLMDNVWINGSFEIKQQNISKILEFYTTDFGLENQLWALSNNETIPLLKSHQFTFGALYKHKNWIIDLDLYKREIDGLTSLTSGFNSYVKTIYTGKASTLGLDVLIKKSWKNYNTWLSYSTGSTDFLFRGFNDDKEFKGNFDISHSFYFAHNYTYKKFNFSLGWNYRVGIPFSSSRGTDDNYGILREGVNNKRLPNYHRLDFSSTYSFLLNKPKKWKAKIGVSVLNLYNKKSVLKRNYDVIFNDKYEATLIQKNTNSLGITPNVIFRVQF